MNSAPLAPGWFAPSAPSAWRTLLQPKEHGSWSLAFEPVALGLLAAPSWPGASLALAVVAGFLARRPLRLAVAEANPVRRAAARFAVAGCAVFASAALGASIVSAGVAWLLWLAPSLACGGWFLMLDLQGKGRVEAAEVAGAAAFAFLPAAFAALAGQPGSLAVALGWVMAVRAVPTVLFIRAMVRARKGEPPTFDRAWFTAGAGLLVTTGLVARGQAPVTAAIWGGLLLARAIGLQSRRSLRPRSLGLFEAVIGVSFVATLALAWR